MNNGINGTALGNGGAAKKAPTTSGNASSGSSRSWFGQGGYLSSIPSRGNTIFGYAPWEGGGFGVNRWEKQMNTKAVNQYKGKYTKSEAAAVITGDIADKIFDNMIKVGDEASSSFITKTVDDYLDNKYKQEKKAEGPKVEEPKVEQPVEEDDIVTIIAGQDGKGFGQRLLDNGLATNHGLWGSDGDVAYYTRQLYEQGALDERGNLKLGVPIRLKRRKD